MNITLNYGSLYEIVARSLSAIGKRANDNNGNNIFGTITLGSAEKKIVCDFINNAFTELCATLDKFITSEIRNMSSFSNSEHIDFWSDQTPSTDNITRNGQLLYRYDKLKLYESRLAFPFETYETSATGVFKYNDNYYDNTLTLIEEPTDEQKAAAIALDYFGTDPQTISAYSAGLLAGYEGSIYESVRQASFEETDPSASAIYYDPSGVAYRWQYGAMQVTPGGMDDSIELVVTTPDNWNASLQLSFRQALTNYCVSYTLYSWFAVTAPHISDKYLQDSQSQLLTIIDIIHDKKSSKKPTYQYPSELTVSEDAVDIGVEEEYDIKYSISNGTIDDVEMVVGDALLVDCKRCGSWFAITGKQLGHTTVQLYSRHNKELAKTIDVYVTDQS